jgi:hypothetical protein
MQHANGFASGTDSMFAVGEVVGSTSDMDGWSASSYVQNRAGTFDFNLRAFGSGGGIYSMVSNGNNYDMRQIPGTQDAQSQRSINYSGINANVYRTVPFVNSHDTQRPILDASGNYSQPLGIVSGWDISNELGGNGSNGGHIDPRDPRLAASYAIISAVDGNPVFYIEDLFDIGTTGKRYSHLPTSTTDLPVRGDLQNLLQAQQKLGFKDGAYGVPTAITTTNQTPYYAQGDVNGKDHLVIERTGKALIGISDVYNAVSDNSQDRQVYVTTQFPIGTVLYDYSGAHGISSNTVTNYFGDNSNHRVLVQTAPAGHTIPGANGHGYSIWAPYPGTPTSVNDLYNYIATYTPQRNPQTTQEWEMADDLGDSHCSSLGQGGQIPANSTHQRVAGKIFAAANMPITYIIYPQIDGLNVTTSLWDNNGNKLAETAGITTNAAPLTNTYTPTTDGWIVMKVRSSNATQAAQKCYVNVTYTAPAVVNTRTAANTDSLNASIWTGNKNTNDVTDCGNWEQGNIPVSTSNIYIPAYSSPFPQLTSDLTINNITIEQGAGIDMNGHTLTVTGNWNNLNTSSTSTSACGANGGTVNFAGSSLQQVNGSNTFCTLQISNGSNASLNGNNTVTQQLVLNNGNFVLNNNNLVLQPTATISGGSANSYVQPTTNTLATSGFLVETVSSSPAFFPVGNGNFTPATITNSGTPMPFSIGCFEDVLTNGTSGTSIATSGKIKKTWVINPASASGANATITLQWNTINSDGLDNNNCFISKNEGGAGQGWTSTQSAGSASGSNPFTLTTSGITVFSKFSVFSNASILPVNFLNVSASVSGNNAIVNWQVANQQNLASYAIEKSTDGSSFTTIDKQTPQAGNGLLSYQFTDNNFTQNAYYRIVSIDLDGTKQYSQLVFLRKGNVDNSSFLLAPNPVHNNFKLLSNVATTSLLQATLMAADGRILGFENGSLDTVSNGLNTKMQAQPQGIYLIKITAAGGSQILRLVKQ